MVVLARSVAVIFGTLLVLGFGTANAEANKARECLSVLKETPDMLQLRAFQQGIIYKGCQDLTLADIETLKHKERLEFFLETATMTEASMGVRHGDDTLRCIRLQMRKRGEEFEVPEDLKLFFQSRARALKWWDAGKADAAKLIAFLTEAVVKGLCRDTLSSEYGQQDKLVSEVSKMEARLMDQYVFDIVNDRVAYIRAKYGKDALQCILKFFTRLDFPNSLTNYGSGHSEAKKFIIYANEVGYQNRSAIRVINIAVDTVGKDNCGLEPIQN